MSVFPNDVSSINSNDTDRSLVQRMENAWSAHSAQNLYFQTQAEIDLRFYSNDQYIWNDMYGSELPFNRQQFNFNLIRRIVEMPVGFQRQNRKSTIAIPLEGSDQKTADQFTKLLMWNDQQDSVNETISDAFRGACITGMNLLQVWVDFGKDPISGDIKVDNCPFNSFIIDPYFKKTDLSDCNFIWKRNFVTHEQAQFLLPEHKDEIAGIGVSGISDGKFTFMPEQIFNNGSYSLLTYDEFFYRTYRKAIKLHDPDRGITVEWTFSESELKEFLRQAPQIKVERSQVPTVNQGIVVQGRVFYNGGNLLGIDEYPFVPTLGYYAPELDTLENRVQGLVRSLRDTQFLFNRTMINMLDIWESQPNSGWVAKEDTVVNPKSLHKTGQGQVIWRKKDSASEDLVKLTPATIPQGFFEMNTQLNNLTQMISGVNEELLGSATDDKAGVLSMLRQGAGLLTLRTLFDQLDTTQKLLGRIRLRVMQNNFTPAKVERVLAEPPTREFYDRDFGTYDTAVEEGFNTSTQRQLEFAQLLHMKELGVPIPESRLIQAATIQNKDEIIQEMAQEAQQKQQIEAQAAQALQQEQEARTNLANARAVADQGLGMERVSRIQENQQLAVERRAEAEKDIEQASLNRIKGLKELQDIDISQIERLLSIAKMLEQDAQVTSEVVE